MNRKHMQQGMPQNKTSSICRLHACRHALPPQRLQRCRQPVQTFVQPFPSAHIPHATLLQVLTKPRHMNQVQTHLLPPTKNDISNAGCRLLAHEIRNCVQVKAGKTKKGTNTLLRWSPGRAIAGASRRAGSARLPPLLCSTRSSARSAKLTSRARSLRMALPVRDHVSPKQALCTRASAIGDTCAAATPSPRMTRMPQTVSWSCWQYTGSTHLILFIREHQYCAVPHERV